MCSQGAATTAKASSLTASVAVATAKASILTASVAAATARWSRGVGRRRRRGGAGGVWGEVGDLVETAKFLLIYPGHWYRFVAKTGTNATFSPGLCHQPGKVSFQQPKGREAEAFGPGWWHQPGIKGGIGPGWCHESVPMHHFSPGWWHQPGPKALCCPRRGQKFSPTSLVERAREWFISTTAPTLSSSSPLQAYGPNCHCYA